MLASRFALRRRVWLASAARAAKNRGVAHDVQSRNGKVPREIERKFLLKRLPPNLRHFHSRTIEQGYLSVKTDGTQIRLRKSGRRHSLTIKRGRGLSRQEVEFRDERECRLFQPPEWFAAEVSGKSRYSNVRLARE